MPRGTGIDKTAVVVPSLHGETQSDRQATVKIASRAAMPAASQPCLAFADRDGVLAGRLTRITGMSRSASCASCSCRRPAFAFGAVRRVGGEPCHSASRTCGSSVAGDARPSGGLRFRVRRRCARRGYVHASHCAESAPSRQVPRLPGERCHASRFPRAWSRQRRGQGRAGASLGRRLPPRTDAKRPRRPSGAPLLRAPGLRSGPQDSIRRLKKLSEAQRWLSSHRSNRLRNRVHLRPKAAGNARALVLHLHAAHPCG